VTALFIGSEIYRRSSYGSKHPLAIPRVSTVIDLCRALGWLPEARYIDSPMASEEELARFHAPDYIAAVRDAEAQGAVSAETGRRYGLGRNGNPIFPEVFSRPATACGGSLLAARLLSGTSAAARPEARIVYNPAGGTHHGRPAEASGFCYFNDPVLAILALLDRGAERVFYLDIDAHHGDGVQAAVRGDHRVMTVSVHEEGRWPMVVGGAGGRADRGGGNARNIPVPAAFNDTEMDFVLENAILPLLSDFEPSAVVLQGGADGLTEDPLSRLALSNRALWRVVEAVKPYAPRFLVLGGGGYNPWAVARCWTGIWAVLDGHEVPDRLPPEAEAVLRALRWRHSSGRNPLPEWSTTLADDARPGPVREEVRAGVRAVLS
jgi:acetoin utilization protein AcuC